MELQWQKQAAGNWCLLDAADLTGMGSRYGVFIIWRNGGAEKVSAVLYVGRGRLKAELAECRRSPLFNAPRLRMTWAEVDDPNDLDGIATYLYQHLRPIWGEIMTSALPVPVNLPLTAGRALALDDPMRLIRGSDPESRAPVVLIAGRRGTSAIAADLEGLLRASGRAVRRGASKHRTASSERRATLHRDVAQLAPRKPRTGVLVTAASPAHLGRRGVPLHRCSVAAVADFARSPDSDSFRRGVDAVLKATSGLVVIDADNAAAVAATRPLDRARLVLCAARESEVVLRHAALGGPVVVRVDRAGGEHIELRSAGTVLASTSVPLPRSSGRGPLPRRVRARMFALALAFGLGVSSQQLAAAEQRRDRGAVLIGHERVAAARAARGLTLLD